MKNLSNNFLKLYFFLLIIFIGIGIWLYLFSNIAVKKQNIEIIKIEIDHAKNFAQNINRYLKNISHNLTLKEATNDKNIIKQINNTLSLFAGKQYRYIYIVYIDKNGLPRYLADGSKDISQRGELHQRFIPLLDIWDKIIEKGNAIYATQKKSTGLWITYLYPVQIFKNTRTILSFDISIDEYHALFSIVKPLNNILFLASIFLFFILLFILFQTYLYLKQRNKNYIDPLTRLYNRNYLKEIQNRVKLENCVVAMADIDHFKSINDNYGHDVGDIVLENIAKRLISSVSAEDEVIRFGGEEFLIIINGRDNNIKTTENIFNRVLHTVSSKPVDIGKGETNVTISIGVNANPSNDSSFEKAIKRADEMLYLAKNSGRNRAVITENNNSLDHKDA